MKILRKIGIVICVIIMTFIVLFNVNEVMFKTENERINIFGYKLMNIDNKYDYYLVKETKVKDIILYDNVSFRVADSYKDFNSGLVKGKINDCLKLKDNNTVVCDNNLEGKVVMKISGARNLLFVNKGSIIILVVCNILLILVFLWKPGKKKKKAVETVKAKEENAETSEIKEEFEKSENSDNQTIVIDTTPFDANRNEMISNNENQTVVVESTVPQEEVPVENNQTVVVEPPVQEEVPIDANQTVVVESTVPQEEAPMEEAVNEPVENNQTVVIESTMPQEEPVNSQTIVIDPTVSTEVPMENQFEVSQEETPVEENQVEMSQMEVPVDNSQVIAIDPNPMKEEIREEAPTVQNEIVNNDVQEFDNYNVNVNEIDLSKFSGEEVKPIEEAHFEFNNDVEENVTPFDNTEIEEDRMIQAGDLDDVAEPTESYQSETHEEFMEEATPIVEETPEISAVEPIETASEVEPIEEKVQEEPIEVKDNNMDFSNYIFEKVQNTTVDNVTIPEEKESPNINNIFENKSNTVEINVDEVLDEKPKKVKVTPIYSSNQDADSDVEVL